MTRTGPGVLIAAAVLGIVGGFGLDQVLTSMGRATFRPDVTLPILLVLLGGLSLALAIPIRRATRGKGTIVNPFRALRVAVLAKASSIVGAALGGFGAGLLLFLLTRQVVPSVGSMATVIMTAVCGGLLVVAALIADHLCTIRKDDDDQQSGGDDPGLEPGIR